MSSRLASTTHSSADTTASEPAVPSRARTTLGRSGQDLCPAPTPTASNVNEGIGPNPSANARTSAAPVGVTVSDVSVVSTVGAPRKR